MKRPLLTLALFLLLGAIVNVAVAWAAAVFTCVSLQEGPTDMRDVVEALVNPRMGATQVWFTCSDLPDETRNPRAVPYWVRWPTEVPVDPYTESIHWHERHDGYGWPVRALACSWRTVSSAGEDFRYEFEGGIEMDSRGEGFVGERLRALPLRPIWSGFAINTVFYAAILWPLICGPFARRRHIRRKRGLCVACGYDLRHADHDVCPECGTVA